MGILAILSLHPPLGRLCVVSTGNLRGAVRGSHCPASSEQPLRVGSAIVTTRILCGFSKIILGKPLCQRQLCLQNARPPDFFRTRAGNVFRWVYRGIFRARILVQVFIGARAPESRGFPMTLGRWGEGSAPVGHQTCHQIRRNWRPRKLVTTIPWPGRRVSRHHPATSWSNNT